MTGVKVCLLIIACSLVACVLTDAQKADKAKPSEGVCRYGDIECASERARPDNSIDNTSANDAIPWLGEDIATFLQSSRESSIELQQAMNKLIRAKSYSDARTVFRSEALCTEGYTWHSLAAEYLLQYIISLQDPSRAPRIEDVLAPLLWITGAVRGSIETARCVLRILSHIDRYRSKIAQVWLRTPSLIDRDSISVIVTCLGDSAKWGNDDVSHLVSNIAGGGALSEKDALRIVELWRSGNQQLRGIIAIASMTDAATYLDCIERTVVSEIGGSSRNDDKMSEYARLLMRYGRKAVLRMLLGAKVETWSPQLKEPAYLDSVLRCIATPNASKLWLSDGEVAGVEDVPQKYYEDVHEYINSQECNELLYNDVLNVWTRPHAPKEK
ncbi:MAG: hypothetical protein M5U25_15965 [Planctomycetota bacterium]|nr:hypothetical protein [Planctomycetota bacterium]